MVDRINLILKAKNLSPRQFAEEIGIQPSGMSHILSGRNRPSLDFVMKVVSRYPEIDIKWLTLGIGEMFVQPYSLPSQSAKSASPAPKTEVKAEPKITTNPSPITEPKPFSNLEPRPVPNPEPDLFSSFLNKPTVGEQTIAASQNISDGDMEPLQQAPVQPQQMPHQQEQQPSIVPNTQPSTTANAPASTILEPQVASQSQSPLSIDQPSAPQPARLESVTDSPYSTASMQTSLQGQSINKADENRLYDSRREVDAKYRTVAKKRIVKVVILYDDHSFEEYSPEN